MIKAEASIEIEVPAQIGDHIPDWSINRHEDDQDRIYLIRESKVAIEEVKRRPAENAKIEATKKHFGAIGVPNIAISVPGYRLSVAMRKYPLVAN